MYLDPTFATPPPGGSRFVPWPNILTGLGIGFRHESCTSYSPGSVSTESKSGQQSGVCCLCDKTLRFPSSACSGRLPDIQPGESDPIPTRDPADSIPNRQTTPHSLCRCLARVDPMRPVAITSTWSSYTGGLVLSEVFAPWEEKKKEQGH